MRERRFETELVKRGMHFRWCLRWFWEGISGTLFLYLLRRFTIFFHSLHNFFSFAVLTNGTSLMFLS